MQNWMHKNNGGAKFQMSERGHSPHGGSIKPRRRRWSLVFESFLPHRVRVRAGGRADDAADGESDDLRRRGIAVSKDNKFVAMAERPSLDLDSCIAIIETIGDGDIDGGLTSSQRNAIRDLRSNIVIATSDRHSSSSSPRVTHNGYHVQDDDIDDDDDDHHHRSVDRMGMMNRSIERRKAESFLDLELTRCVQEMADDVDDEDGHRHVSDILTSYGGQFVNSVLRRVKGGSARGASEEMGGGEGSSSIIVGSSIGINTVPIIGERTCDDGQAGNNILRSHSDGRDETSPTRRRSSDRRSAFVSFASKMIPRDELLSMSDRSIDDLYNDDRSGLPSYCPPEWNALNRRTRAKLTGLLSWENLSRWEFDIVEVTELSKDTMNDPSSRVGHNYGQCCPLLLVGWAILCAPMAQRAMEGSLGDVSSSMAAAACRGDDRGGDGSKDASSFLYPFSDMKIVPECVCNFLREVEGRYMCENFYHNNVHAADVVQTLHCLLQYIGEDDLRAIYDPLDVFSLLLAATFHDVGHPGRNNLYQKHARTELAIVYNDASILENMHSAVGHSLLLGETRDQRWDIFRHFDARQIERARGVMISAVLGTDMGNHFECVGKLVGYMENVRTATSTTYLGLENEQPILSILVRVLGPENNRNGKDEPLVKECLQLANGILKFLLHAADISNPAKKLDLAGFWADRALKEFFAQGDAEKEQGLPISPLCDRNTVKKPDSQIGFLKFVIRPTYLLLGELLPRVKGEVMPIIDEQIEYWMNEKSVGRMSSGG